MLLYYRDRTNRWVIEVTYESGNVYTYGPFYAKLMAEWFLRTRLVDNSYDGTRGRAIQSARVTRLRRHPSDTYHGLLGVRLVLP